MMIHKTIIDWFCLINSKGVGPKTFWSLLKTYKSANIALQNVQDPFPEQEAQKILNNFKGYILLASDPMFPTELKRSPMCPPILFAKGNLSMLQTPKIAIIGARNASLNGKSIARKMAKDLSNYFTIVSGLANGIDTSAHLGALQNANSKVIGVMPFSFEHIYPKENEKLFATVIERGLAITEVPPHRPPDQGMFFARNKIIAMMSSGIITIEAALKSGTISTAQVALDLGTEVMAVPGSPTDPRSRGCNQLIKNGAPLVEDYTDVLEHLGYTYTSEQSNIQLKDSCSLPRDISAQILSMLSTDRPIPLETIAENLNLDVKDILCNISELEIRGKISKHSSNEVIRNV